MRNTYAEKLMTLVSNAHLWHFYTKSYAAHDALDKFYTGLQESADKYIESDMGAHEVTIEPSGKPFYYVGLDSAIHTLQTFAKDTKQMRALQEDNPGLISTLDEILTLVDQTIYRLSNLS